MNHAWNMENLLKIQAVELSSIVAMPTRSKHTDVPEKFSTSKAKSWDSINTFMENRGKDIPEFQIVIILIQFTIMLVYFFFRESNGIDEIIDQPLFLTVPNIKKNTLQAEIDYYERLGLDTTALRKALENEKRLDQETHIKNSK